MTAGDGFGVTAFGKHPGWADHIDDIPVPTGELHRVRDRLYAHGIRQVVDRGGWAELADEKRLGGFNHWFLWIAEGTAIAGRMRKSTDASGRSAYPFVACVQAPEEEADWLADQAVPLLDSLVTRCADLATGEEVIEAVTTSHEQFGSLAEAGQSSERASTCTADIVEQIGREGVHRILYQMEREMRAYAEGGRGTSSEKIDRSPRHIRLPGLDGPSLSVLSRWVGFMREHLALGVPMLAVCPDGPDWCDVIVGELDDQTLVPVMMNLEGMRPASETAYQLDEEFVARADEAIGRSVEEILERERASLEGSRRGVMRKGADAAKSKGLGLGRWLRGKPNT